MSLVRDFYNSQWFLIIMITLAVWVFVSSESIIMYTMKQAHGDDSESELGLCLRGWTARCPETKLQHDLEGRLMIWNSLNCSVRDICNVHPVNDTNDQYQCFEDKHYADEYVKKYGNHSDVFTPCRPFDLPKQEDESGK